MSDKRNLGKLKARKPSSTSEYLSRSLEKATGKAKLNTRKGVPARPDRADYPDYNSWYKADQQWHSKHGGNAN